MAGQLSTREAWLFRQAQGWDLLCRPLPCARVALAPFRCFILFLGLVCRRGTVRPALVLKDWSLSRLGSTLGSHS